MRSCSGWSYENIIRWDMITRFEDYDTPVLLPKIESMFFHMYESRIKNKKDKYVLAFLTELITGQRVSPKLLSKKSYKISLVVKRTQPTVARSQVTLRNENFYLFMDKFTKFGLPRSIQFNGFRELKGDAHGNVSMHADDIYSFVEMEGMSPYIHKCNGPQLQFRVNYCEYPKTQYMLSSYQVPLNGEGAIINKSYPNLNFFNK